MTGSNITYKPPEGTKRIEYNFNFKHEVDAGYAIGSYALFVDDVEVLYARTDISASEMNTRVDYKWIFECAAATNDTNYGAFTSWTTPKNIHMEGREYNSSHQIKLHQTNYWENAGANHFSAPVITITAYS